MREVTALSVIPYIPDVSRDVRASKTDILRFTGASAKAKAICKPITNILRALY